MKITVYGAGVFGTTLGKILEENKHQVLYYNRNSKISPKEATDFADVILLSVPSSAIQEVIKLLPAEKPLIIATKGLLSIAPFKKFKKVAFLSGGAFAAELDNHLKTTLTATDKLIPKLFKTSWLDFEITKDSLGVILCGALKNIYAIYAGFEDISKTPKKRAALIRQTANEMKKILAANGANPKTVDLACGIGDLKVTFTASSRNYRFGQTLAQDPNYQPTETTEGLSAFINLQKSDIIIPDELEIFSKIKELLKERS